MLIIFAALLGGGIFLAQRILYARWWDKGVSVTLQFDREMVRAGESVKLSEIVENYKKLPLSSLKVKFQCSRYLVFADCQNGMVTDRYYRNDLFTIMPYQRITRTHQITCPRRGYFGIEGIDLVGADLFFSEELTAERESSAFLYVAPKILSKQGLAPAFRKINGEIAAKRYELEDAFTLRGIRDYEPYDEMKRINWKATAKTNELKVNERDYTTISSVRIFMNLKDTSILKSQELVEMSICICASLVQEFLYQGIVVSIFANGTDCVTGESLCMEGMNGPACLDTVYKALARLDLESQMPVFGDCLGRKLFEENSLYTVFISHDRHEDYMELIRRYQKRAGDGFAIICPVEDASENRPVTGLEDKIIYLCEDRG